MIPSSYTFDRVILKLLNTFLLNKARLNTVSSPISAGGPEKFLSLANRGGLALFDFLQGESVKRREWVFSGGPLHSNNRNHNVL